MYETKQQVSIFRQAQYDRSKYFPVGKGLEAGTTSLFSSVLSVIANLTSAHFGILRLRSAHVALRKSSVGAAKNLIKHTSLRGRNDRSNLLKLSRLLRHASSQ